MGMRAITDERGVKVWLDDKGQYPRYSFSISKKNDAGKYDNFYMEVKFNQALDKPDNGDDILIKDSFLSFNVWTGKDGKKHTTPYLMIMDYENMNGEKKKADFIDIPDGLDDAVPFR